MPTKYQGSPEEEAALNAAITLVRAAETLRVYLESKRSIDGLTMTQFSVLDALLHIGPLCQNELAEKLMVTGPNITRVIDALERAGLVERVRSRQDRRYVMVTLTEEGHGRISEIFPRHVADLVYAFSSLSLVELGQVRFLCKTLGLSLLPQK